MAKRYVGSMLLQPRSLVVVKDDMYLKYLHGIGQRSEDIIIEDKIFNSQFCTGKFAPGNRVERNTRISMTIRNVPKVSKLSVQDLLLKK